MSAYNGRRGPNVSAYVANLNTIAPEETQEQPNPDFSMFLETDFFDSYDTTIDLNAPLDVDLNTIETPTPAASATDPKMNFDLNSDFQYADFSTFPQPLSIDTSSSNPLPTTSSTYPVGAAYAPSVSSTVSPTFDAPAGKKRRLDAAETPNPQATDEAARIAAEEDKRRRNTAASARFRVKKKQREQALEKTARDMTERVTMLEARIAQLETENTWLKGLITEKNGGKASSSEIKALLTKHESERSNGNRTDGVGTEASSSKA